MLATTSCEHRLKVGLLSDQRFIMAINKEPAGDCLPLLSMEYFMIRTAVITAGLGFALASLSNAAALAFSSTFANTTPPAVTGSRCAALTVKIGKSALLRDWQLELWKLHWKPGSLPQCRPAHRGWYGEHALS